VIYRHPTEGATMKRWVSPRAFCISRVSGTYFSRVPVTAIVLFLPIGVFPQVEGIKFTLCPPPQHSKVDVLDLA